MELRRPLNGALAGAAAAAAWAAQQPLDKRVFGSRYDDVELLGKLVTPGAAGPPPRARVARRRARAAHGERRDVRSGLRARATARAGPAGRGRNRRRDGGALRLL